MAGSIERKPSAEGKQRKHKGNGGIFAVVRPDGNSIIIDRLAPKPAYGQKQEEKNSGQE